jgi:hypothetical protein
MTAEELARVLRGYPGDLELVPVELQCGYVPRRSTRSVGGPYFWDAARGWIDAQRTMGVIVPKPDLRRPE